MHVLRYNISIIAIILCFSFPLFSQTEFADSLIYDGLTRTFIVHLPPAYNGIDPMPLVMVLHGGGSGDGTTARDKMHFEEVGDTTNYITVFPNGYYNDWADGRGVSSADTAGIDDVSFLTTLKDTLINQYAIDTCKTYITGPSNGGMMSLRIASEKPHSFSAYAPIISSLPDSIAINFNPQIPVSLLLMPGTSDPLIPYEGGNLSPLAGGSVIGVDSTIALFLANNGCANVNPDSTLFPDIDPTDNSTVTRYDYGFWNDSSEVVLYKIIGGGHTIPGMEAITNPLPLVGYVNYDIDAAVEIWEFLKRHKKRKDPTSIIISNFLPNPASFELYQNFPNPFNPVTKISLLLHKRLPVKLTIYNALGQQIETLVNQNLSVGFHTFDFDGRALPSGNYYVKAEVGVETSYKKIMLLK